MNEFTEVSGEIIVKRTIVCPNCNRSDDERNPHYNTLLNHKFNADGYTFTEYWECKECGQKYQTSYYL